MSEWLTTGQMIDRLKDGEIARSSDKDYPRIKRISDAIYFINSNNTPIKIVDLIGYKLTLKWRILPKYVSFEEAMKALKDGKTVYYEGKDGENYHDKVTPDEAEFKKISFLNIKDSGLIHMWEGNWTIEGDTNA